MNELRAANAESMAQSIDRSAAEGNAGERGAPKKRLESTNGCRNPTDRLTESFRLSLSLEFVISSRQVIGEQNFGLRASRVGGELRSATSQSQLI